MINNNNKHINIMDRKVSKRMIIFKIKTNIIKKKINK